MDSASKFIPYQEIKIQESAEQVPVGNIPRSFTVVAKGEVTRMCSPGDIILIQGIFMPAQFETWRGLMTTIHVNKYK